MRLGIRRVGERCVFKTTKRQLRRNDDDHLVASGNRIDVLTNVRERIAGTVTPRRRYHERAKNVRAACVIAVLMTRRRTGT